MIALHMIVGGHENPQDLDRCLESVKGQVDKSFVCITSLKPNKELIEVCKKHDAVYELKEFYHKVTKKDVKFILDFGLTPHIQVGDKLFEFDKARNYAMNMVPKEYDWLLWLDTDDVLRGNKLREIANDADSKQIDSVFLNYIYQADIENGVIKAIQIEHLRERLIKNNDLYKWEAPIHETLIEKHPTRKKDYRECDVLHLSSHERMIGAVDRNIKNLEYSIILRDGKDPRPIYYLGKAFFDQWMFKQDQKYIQAAKVLFEKYLLGENPSGWEEERSQCWEYLVEIYRALGEINNAIKCAHNAMIEDERFPSIYANLALCYVFKQQWGRALWWIKAMAKMPQPETTLVATPKAIEMRIYEVVYHACLNLSKLDQAYAAAVKLLELVPDSQEYKNRYEFVSNLREQRDVTKLFVQLARYLEQRGEAHKLKPLLLAAPNIIRGNPFIVDLENKVNPPRKWDKDEIAIYCGPAFTTWSPRHLENSSNDSFVGGSEEAVMYLAKALKNEGWRVTVYADPGIDEGDWEGVKYEPYFRFNTKDQFNVLVSWRRPDLVDQNLRALKTYIWCHDLQNPNDYPPERLAKINKVIVLSPWHRSNIPNVPDEKIMISSNGVSL